MKVLFTIAGLHPESGGPARSVPALCEALGREGVEVEIFSLNYGGRFARPLTPDEKFVRTTYVDCTAPLASRMQWTPRFVSGLRARCRTGGFQIVQDTGLWLLTNQAAARVSGELKLPRIVSPRGMLTGWALQHRGWKKRIAWRLYQRRDLMGAQILHATSVDEAEGFRALGMTQPIAIIPNGVELPPASEAGGNDQRGMGHQAAKGMRTMLFLSRIHPKKGLLDLVKAWNTVRPEGWRVVIAGGDDAGHLGELKAAINSLKLEPVFEFVGPVDGAAKWSLYRTADLFVLPSHSENFGIVIAEALACGVPVITTRGAPWEDLAKHRCGWWTDIGVEPLAAALRDAIARTDTERAEMGARGRLLVERKYGWAGIAAQMHAVYHWMLAGGSRPAWVV